MFILSHGGVHLRASHLLHRCAARHAMLKKTRTRADDKRGEHSAREAPTVRGDPTKGTMSPLPFAFWTLRSIADEVFVLRADGTTEPATGVSIDAREWTGTFAVPGRFELQICDADQD
jgi:hypothetical protein